MVQCADAAATLFVYSLSALAAGVGFEARHPQGEMALQLVPAPCTEPMQSTAAEDAMRAFEYCVRTYPPHVAGATRARCLSGQADECIPNRLCSVLSASRRLPVGGCVYVYCGLITSPSRLYTIMCLTRYCAPQHPAKPSPLMGDGSFVVLYVLCDATGHT